MYFFVSDEDADSVIESNIIFGEGIVPQDSYGLEKLGASLFKKQGQLVYIEENMSVDISLSKGKMVLNSKVRKELGFVAWTKKILKYMLGRPVERNDQFFMMLRRLVVFPIFYYGENYLNRYLMHASAFRFKKTTVVMAGLSNIGKSTTSLSAVLDLGGEILSDNYLIYDSKNVFCFPELMRISDDTLNLIENRKNLGKHLYIRGKRKLYPLKSSQIVNNASPDVLVIPSLGDHCEHRRISVEYAVDIIMSSNEFVNEFHNTDFISISNRIEEGPYPVYQNRINALSSMLEGCSIYMVVLSVHQAPKKNVNYLIDTLANMDATNANS